MEILGTNRSNYCFECPKCSEIAQEFYVRMNYIEYSRASSDQQVDKEGLTDLHIAVKDNNIVSVRELLNERNVNVRDVNGWTPLHVAAHEGHGYLALLLLKVNQKKTK